MQDRLRRVLALVLSFMMLFSNVPVSAIAEGIAEAAQQNQSAPAAPAEEPEAAPAPEQSEPSNTQDDSAFMEDPSANAQGDAPAVDADMPQEGELLVGKTEDDVQVSAPFQFGVTPIATETEAQFDVTMEVQVKKGNKTAQSYRGAGTVGTIAVESGDTLTYRVTITNESATTLTLKFSSFIQCNAWNYSSGMAVRKPKPSGSGSNPYNYTFSGNGSYTLDNGNHDPWKIVLNPNGKATLVSAAVPVDATFAAGDTVSNTAQVWLYDDGAKTTMKTSSVSVQVPDGPLNAFGYSMAIQGADFQKSEAGTVSMWLHNQTASSKDDYFYENKDRESYQIDDDTKNIKIVSNGLTSGGAYKYVHGSNYSGSETNIQVTNATPVYTPQNNAKDKYIFMGWYDKTGDGTIVRPGGTVDSHNGNAIHTIDAIWGYLKSKDITLVYDAQEHVIELPEFKLATEGNKYTKEDVESSLGTPTYTIHVTGPKIDTTVEDVTHATLNSELEKLKYSEVGVYTYEIVATYKHENVETELPTTAVLTILPRPIVLEVKQATALYDGLPHTVKLNANGEEDTKGTGSDEFVDYTLRLKRSEYVEQNGGLKSTFADALLTALKKDSRFSAIYEDAETLPYDYKEADVSLADGENEADFQFKEAPVIVYSEAGHPNETAPGEYRAWVKNSEKFSGDYEIAHQNNYVLVIIEGQLTITTDGLPSLTIQKKVEDYNSNYEGGTFRFSVLDSNGKAVKFVKITEKGQKKIVMIAPDADTTGLDVLSSIEITLSAAEKEGSIELLMLPGTYTVQEEPHDDYTATYSATGGENTYTADTVSVTLAKGDKKTTYVCNNAKHIHVEHYVIDLNTTMGTPVDGRTSASSSDGSFELEGNEVAGKPEVGGVYNTDGSLQSAGFTRYGAPVDLDWKETLTFKSVNESYKEGSFAPTYEDQGITSGNSPKDGKGNSTTDDVNPTQGLKTYEYVYAGATHTGTDGKSGSFTGDTLKQTANATLGVSANADYLAKHETDGKSDKVKPGETVQVYWVRKLAEGPDAYDGIGVTTSVVTGDSNAIRQGEVTVQTHYVMTTGTVAQHAFSASTSDVLGTDVDTIKYRWQSINKADLKPVNASNSYIFHSAVAKQWNNGKSNYQPLNPKEALSGQTAATVGDKVISLIDNAWQNEQVDIYLVPLIKVEYLIDDAPYEAKNDSDDPLYTVEYSVDGNGRSVGTNANVGKGTEHPYAFDVDAVPGNSNTQQGYTTDDWTVRTYPGDSGTVVSGARNLKAATDDNLYKKSASGTALDDADGVLHVRLYLYTYTVDKDVQILRQDASGNWQTVTGKDAKAKAGDKLVYTVTITNNAPEAIEQTVTDTFTINGQGATLTKKLELDASKSVGDNPAYNSTTQKVTVPAKKNGTPGKAVLTAEYTLEGWETSPIVNTVKVGDPDDPNTPGDSTSTDVENNPKLTVEKSAAEMSGYTFGDTVTYTITVKNSGNMPLKNVKLTDELTGLTIDQNAKRKTREGVETDFTLPSDASPVVIGELAVGETVTITATYTVAAGDIASGEITNTATATGETADGKKTEDSGEVTVETDEPNPALKVRKDVKKIESPEEVGQDGNVTQWKENTEADYKAQLGDRITYTITVKNTGNVDLTDVQLADELENLTFDATVTRTDRDDQVTHDTLASTVSPVTIGKLAVGETVTITATYIVTEANITMGVVYNVAEATGKDHDGKTVEHKDDETVQTAQMLGALLITKTVDPECKPTSGNLFKENDEIVFLIEVENKGNVTLTNVEVTEQLPDVEYMSGEGYTVSDHVATITELKPGAKVVLKAKYTVKQQDIVNGGIFNAVFGSGSTPSPAPTPTPGVSTTPTPVPTPTQTSGSETPSPTPTATPGSQVLVTPEPANPSFTLTKEVMGVEDGEKPGQWKSKDEYALGDKVRYKITVTNNGNVDLTNVTVEDGLTGATLVADDAYTINEENKAVIAKLKVGDTVYVYAEYTITEQDIKTGKVNNVAIGSATGPVPTVTPEPGASSTPNPTPLPVPTPSASAEAPTEPQKPAWTVNKLVNGQESLSGVAVGAELTYTIEVKNTGNVTLEKLYLTETFGGNAEYLTFVKAESSDKTAAAATYSDGIILGLKPNETMTITYTYTVQGDDKTVKNTATVDDDPYPDPDDPNDPDDKTPPVSDSTTTEVVDNPKWTVEKTASAACPNPLPEGHETASAGQGKAHVNDTVTYTITVKNTGNVQIQKHVNDTFTVNDNAQTPALTLTKSALSDEGVVYDTKTGMLTVPKGATAVLTATYDVTATDNKLYNFVKVGDDENDPHDDETTQVVGNDALTVVKSVEKIECPNPIPNGDEDAHGKRQSGANGPIAHVGDTITYKIIVSNTGNTNLTGLTIRDQLTKQPQIAGVDQIESLLVKDENGTQYDADKTFDLAQGTSKTFTATYVVKSTDKTLNNEATVRGEEGENTTDVAAKPALDVQKKVAYIVTKNDEGEQETKQGAALNGYKVKVDDEITYTITVKNTGNVTLTNIEVSDPWAATDADYTGTLIQTIASLAPGESVDVTFTHKVTQAQIDESETEKKLTNTATASAPDPNNTGKKVTDEGEATVETDPSRSFSAIKTIPAAYNGDGSLKTDFAGYKVNDEVTFAIVVTNTGDVTLTGVTVSEADTELAGVKIVANADEKDDAGKPLYTISRDAKTATILKIAPGESVTVLATYQVTSVDEKMINVATIDDPNQDDEEEPDDPSVVVPRKAWTVDKSVSGMTGSYVDANKKPVPKGTEGAVHSARVGDELTYTVTVKNTGEVTLSGLTVGDNMLPQDRSSVRQTVNPTTSKAKFDPESGKINDLAAGESITLTYTYTVSKEDNQLENTATISDGTTDVPSGTKTPVERWKIEKKLAQVNGKAAFSEAKESDVKAGAELTYEITVENTGDVTLNGLVIGDELNNKGEVDAQGKPKFKAFDPSNLSIKQEKGNKSEATLSGNTLSNLAPGEKVTLVYTYTVAEGDTFLTNVATASKQQTPDPDPDDPNPPTPGDTTERSNEVPTVVYIKVTVTKIWQDGSGNALNADVLAGLLGDNSISAVLYRNGVWMDDVQEKALLSDNGWSATFTDLPAVDANHELYQYEVKEKKSGEENEDRFAGNNDTFTLGDYSFDASVTGGRKTNSADFAYTITNKLKQQAPSEPQKDAYWTSGEEIKDDEGVQIGDVITYTITRTSHLATTSTATIIDELPDGLTFDATTKALFTVKVNGKDVTQEPKPTLSQSVKNDGKTITWTIKNVPPMATVTITYQVTVNESAFSEENGELVNTAKAGFGDPTDSSIFKQTTEEVGVKEPALSVVKSALTSDKSQALKAVKPGEKIVYELKVTNSGEGRAKGVVVVDQLPSANTVTLMENSFEKLENGKLVSAADDVEIDEDGNISWSVGDLEAGETAVLYFQMQVRQSRNGYVPGFAKNVTNIATITEGLPPETPEEDRESSAVTPIADIRIDKSGSSTDPVVNGKYEIGATITYKLTVENIGGVDLTDVTVSDTRFMGAQKDESDKPIITLKQNGQESRLELSGEKNDTVTIGKMKSGEKVTITYNYVVTEADVADTEPIINVATVNAKYPKDPSDPQSETKPTTPHSDTETMPAQPTPAWLVTKSVSGMTGPRGTQGGTYTRVGDVLTYTITVENTGTVRLDNITVTDVMFGRAQGGVMIAINDGTAAAATVENNTITIPVLERGDIATITYTYLVKLEDMGKPLNNTATSKVPKSDGSEGDEENQYEPDDDHPDRENPSEDSTTTHVENWTVVKKVGIEDEDGEWRQLAKDEGVETGVTLVYHIEVTNRSSHTLSGLKVKDVFGANTTVAAAALRKVRDTLGSSYTVVDGEGVINNLPAGRTITLEYRYQVADADAGTMLTNAVQVGGNDGPGSSVSTPVNKYEVTKTASVKHQSDCHDQYEKIAHVGDTIEYTITVSNTGIVGLKGLQLKDVFTAGETDMGAKLTWVDGDPSATFDLEVSGKKTFTAKYIVEETTEQLANVASVGKASSDKITTGVEAWKIDKDLTLVNDAAPTAQTRVKAGDVLTYTITVENTGSETLNGLSISDQLTGRTGTAAPKYQEESLTKQPETSEATFENGVINALAAGESVTLTYTYTVQPGDAFLSNVAVASKGDPNDPNDPSHKEESKKVETVVYANVAVEKVWLDGDGKEMADDVLELLLKSETPIEIEVQLYRELVKTPAQDKVLISTVKLNAENGWKATLDDLLPMADADGTLYTYSVKEVGEANRRATINGYLFGVTYDVTRDQKTGDINAKVSNRMRETTADKPEKSAKVQGAPGSVLPDNSVESGSTILYTITHTSHLATVATATIKDTLPEGLDFVANSAEMTVMVGDAVVQRETAFAGTVKGRTITWTIENVPPMATVTITYKTTLNESAFTYDKLTNRAEVGFGDPTDDSIFEKADDVDVNVLKPELRIVKTANADVTKPGESFYYELIVYNDGEGKATNVKVEDALPKYVTLEDGWDRYTSGATYDAARRTVIWEIGEIEAKGFKSIRLRVKVNRDTEDESSYLTDGGYVKDFENTATIVEAGEGMSTVKKSSDNTTTEIADVLIKKTGKDNKGAAGPNQSFKDRYIAGDKITYTVTLENVWNVPLKKVTVTDKMFAKALDADKDGYADIKVTNSKGQPVAYTIKSFGTELTLTAPLNPGDKVTITYVYVVRQEDIDLNENIVNTATAGATYDAVKGGSTTGSINEHSDQAEMPALPQPEMEIVKAVSGMTGDVIPGSNPAQRYTKLGDMLNYAIIVTNTGNVALTDVVVEDAMISKARKVYVDGEKAYGLEIVGDTVKIGKLDYSGAVVILYTYEVTEADLANGSVVNRATAKGNDPDGNEIPGGPATTVTQTEAQDPKLSVKKTVSNEPKNGTSYAEGETIEYKIVVTNDGNVTITDVIVTDPKTGDRWMIDWLAPGASQVFTAQHKVTQSEAKAGSVVNTVTATGNAGNRRLADTDSVKSVTKPTPTPTPTPTHRPGHGGATPTPAPDMNATYSMTKSVMNVPSRGYFVEGETVVFNIAITNTGSTMILNFTMTDILTGSRVMSGMGYTVTGNQAFIWSLLPGESVNVQVSYTITAADATRGSVRNVAIGSGSGPDGRPAIGNSAEAAAPTGSQSDSQTGGQTFKVTVHYVYQDDGTTAAPDEVRSGLSSGDLYDIMSPDILGYLASKRHVEGTMQAYDIEFTVFYTREDLEPVLLDEFGVPLNVGYVTMNVGDCFE